MCTHKRCRSMYSMDNDISNYCIVRIYIIILDIIVLYLLYIYIRYNGFLRSVAVSGD